MVVGAIEQVSIPFTDQSEQVRDALGAQRIEEVITTRRIGHDEQHPDRGIDSRRQRVVISSPSRRMCLVLKEDRPIARRDRSSHLFFREEERYSNSRWVENHE